MEGLYKEAVTFADRYNLLNVYGISAVIAVGLAIYSASLAIYRLYFHPLAGFPGPRIAAATRWYEFYYDVIKRGQYVYKIEEMHQKYGPIIRINPHEIVINDPDFYNSVYVAGNTRRTAIWPRYRTGIGFDGSHTMTENHELHRRRRKPLEPFFSRMGIDKMEPMIIEEAKLLNDRLTGLKGSGNVIRLDHVFSAFAGDVIGRICSESPPDMMNHPEFGKEWSAQFDREYRETAPFVHARPATGLVSSLSQSTSACPNRDRLARMIPTGFLLRVYPGAAGFNVFRQLAISHIVDAKKDNFSKEKVEKNSKSSVFRYIITSEMPASECETERLSREAMVLFGAGTATTARTMGFMCYYILTNPHMRERLADELRDVMADYPHKLPSWQELERLPYLQAMIKEGLRLSYGVMRRLPRISPDIPLVYKQWSIPAGTPVGMAAYSLHTDPEVYPEPFKFIPERWLGKYDSRMDRNWVPFSRGSRNCLGMK
uniref:Cytochrome P450 monooxygenase tndB n=1 Tax=Aspergillus flavipes TaxID=41900 RepID=TNDB_ASPFV|nr:RecName: Full=Cytochrome P450 monooxygenase tndB; AltName: Full=Talaronoid C biosynthesis cluster protein B [Aspergillus flavipes]QVR97761.1 TndB [Aspergillus flavipes]